MILTQAHVPNVFVMSVKGPPVGGDMVLSERELASRADTFLTP